MTLDEMQKDEQNVGGAEGAQSAQVEQDAQSAQGAQDVQIDLSELPRINWGALLMPAVWGPAHGQWVTIFFYPIWLLADTCLTNAVIYGGLAIPLAVTVFLGTAAITIFYACTAGRAAYVRVANKMTLQKYLARERIWILVSALIALIFIGLATWYNLAVRLPAGPAA